ncbi:MAG: radical SAM protein [Candidatus Omnitrophota bacterium]|nr:radical SAM protein [Candidatus Omnitrophota bacterium]
MNRIITLNRSSVRIAAGLVRWHISRYLLRRDFPLLATFQLTNKCNFDCRMCNIKNNPRQDTLPLEDFKRIIDDLAEMGTVFVSLSGGEPLLIKNILDYVIYAKSKIPFVNLVTNGYLLSEDTAVGIAKSGLDSLSVSIDALGVKHDAIRGAVGAFDRAIGAIKLVKKHSPATGITVNTVISPWNLDDILALAELVASMGVLQKLQPVYVHPEFNGQAANYQAPKAQEIDISKVKAVIAGLLKKKSVSNSAYFLNCIPDFFAGEFKKDIFEQDCIYPSFCAEFTQDGLMYPCIVGKDWTGGYDVREGLKKVFSSRQYRDEVSRLTKCRLCRKNFSVCYVETRLTLPLTNFVRYNFNFWKQGLI